MCALLHLLCKYDIYVDRLGNRQVCFGMYVNVDMRLAGYITDVNDDDKKNQSGRCTDLAHTCLIWSRYNLQAYVLRCLCTSFGCKQRGMASVCPLGRTCRNSSSGSGEEGRRGIGESDFGVDIRRFKVGRVCKLVGREWIIRFLFVFDAVLGDMWHRTENSGGQMFGRATKPQQRLLSGTKASPSWIL